MKFFEVTQIDGNPVMINLDYVAVLRDNEVRTTAGVYEVKETLPEITKLLEAMGVATVTPGSVRPQS